MLNSDQWKSLLNQAITLLAGGLAITGAVTSSESASLVAAGAVAIPAVVTAVSSLVTLISVVTAIWRRRHTAQVAAGLRSAQALADGH